MLMGEFKQEILRINNKVNMEVFKQGVLTQRVDVMHNRAVIVARNRRVSLLSLPYEMDKASTEVMDRTLINIFKQRFIQLMQEELGLTVIAHLKDYDPALEISASVTFFDRQVERIHGSQEIGTYFIYLFLFVIGAPASIVTVVTEAPLLLVLTAIMETAQAARRRSASGA